MVCVFKKLELIAIGGCEKQHINFIRIDSRKIKTQAVFVIDVILTAQTISKTVDAIRGTI